MKWLNTPGQRTPRPLPDPCAHPYWSGTPYFVHVCAEHGQPAKTLIPARNDTMTVRFECGCEQTVEMKT